MILVGLAVLLLLLFLYLHLGKGWTVREIVRSTLHFFLHLGVKLFLPLIMYFKGGRKFQYVKVEEKNFELVGRLQDKDPTDVRYSSASSSALFPSAFSFFFFLSLLLVLYLSLSPSPFLFSFLGWCASPTFIRCGTTWTFPRATTSSSAATSL